MPGRSYTSQNGYRYGFNSKENDDEVKGEGNQQDYGMRIYDPRVGRFLSIDPITVKYPELTPYQFASNTPLWGSDLDGLEVDFSTAKVQRQKYENYGNKFLNLLFNRDKVGANIGISAYNQTISTVEDATNLLFSTKGREQVALKYGTEVLNLMIANEKFKSGTITISDLLMQTKKYLSNPKNLEDLAGSFVSGWLIGRGINLFSRFTSFKFISSTVSQFKGFNTKGLVIWQGEDAARYLEGQAKAAYMAGENGTGTLILGINPTRQEIVEELIHHQQNLKYGSDYMVKNKNLIEIEAQDKLLKIGKKEGWSEEVMDEIRRAKQTWIEKLNKEKKE